MDKNIKISVLMAVYNGDRYIKESIESILNQSLKDFEFIIVNDGSKDKTLDVIKSFNDSRIVIINNEKNSGLINSLNKGLNAAKGKYIARIDHDDISLPNRFEKQYNFMENNPEIDVVGSWTECIDPDGKSIKITRNPANPIVIKYEFIFNNLMFHSSIFFRTDKIKNNGGYDINHLHSEDYDLYTRPNKELNCANLPEVLFKLRLHNNSITGSNNTQPLVYKNALNIVLRNINKYYNLNKEEFDKIVNILIIKKPDTQTSLFNFIKALKILKKITDSFIKKNKLNTDEINLVLKDYTGRRKMMYQHFIIGRYRKIFKRNE